MAQPNPELVLAEVGITFEEPEASIRERKLTAMKHLEVHMLLWVWLDVFGKPLVGFPPVVRSLDLHGYRGSYTPKMSGCEVKMSKYRWDLLGKSKDDALSFPFKDYI